MDLKINLYVMCFIFCGTLAKVHIRIQPSNVLKMRQHVETCEKETGVPASALKKLIQLPLPTDRPTKEFLFCVCHNAGFIGEDGHANLDNILSLEVVNGTKEEYGNIITKCNAEALEDSVETTNAIIDCLHRHCVFTV